MTNVSCKEKYDNGVTKPLRKPTLTEVLNVKT